MSSSLHFSFFGQSDEKTKNQLPFSGKMWYLFYTENKKKDRKKEWTKQKSLKLSLRQSSYKKSRVQGGIEFLKVLKADEW